MVMHTVYQATAREEALARDVVDCAYRVHTNLGPGLLEAVYEHCFCHELGKRGVAHARQVSVPIVYEGVRLEWGVRLDVPVENRFVCELKSVEVMAPVSWRRS